MPAAAESICQLKWYCSTGVCPRGAQVRTRCGRSLNPLSSMKTIVRRSQSAFFNSRPLHLLPLPNRLLVAFQRPSGRTLAAPTQFAQDAPDVVLVEAHPGPLLDEIPHAARGPQPSGISDRLGPPFERALEIAQLGRAELGWPPSASRLAQAAHAGLPKLPRPAADRLPVHPQLARHLGLAESRSK